MIASVSFDLYHCWLVWYATFKSWQYSFQSYAPCYAKGISGTYL